MAEAAARYRRQLDAATDADERAQKANELALVLLRAGQFADASKAATVVLEITPADTKALFRRAQARLQLGELRAARADLKQAMAAATAQGEEPTFVQSIENVLYRCDATLAEGAYGMMIVTTRRLRTELRHWLYTWRREAHHARLHALLANRLRASLTLPTQRQQLQRWLILWRSAGVQPGLSPNRLQKRGVVADARLRACRQDLLHDVLSSWAELVSSAVWLPDAAKRRTELRDAARKQMWQRYWQVAAVKRKRAAWFPPYFAAWREQVLGSPRERRARRARAEPAADPAALEPEPEPEPEPESELEPARSVSAPATGRVACCHWFGCGRPSRASTFCES